MEITREQVVDMAWKTEGLVKKLTGQKDPRAIQLEKAQFIALWEPVLAGIGDIPAEQPTNEQYQEAYLQMDALAREFNYDSSNRKYATEAE